MWNNREWRLLEKERQEIILFMIADDETLISQKLQRYCSNRSLYRKKESNDQIIELFAEREVSLAEGEAPYICPSNTLRTSTLLLHLYVVRFLTCNSFVIHFAKVAISLETMPVTTQHPF